MKTEWEIIPMGQLCSIKSGKSDTKNAVADGAYAFFDRSRTIKRSSRYIFDCDALIIPGEGAEFLPKHFNGKFDLHQRAYALFNFSNRLDVKFLYHYLHHISDYFPRVAVGATVKSLRLRHFEQLPVSLTSLPEQQRIVTILDQAFASIAMAKANAEKNLQNSRAIFKSHLQSVFTQRGEGWVEKKFEELIESNIIGLTKSSREQGDEKSWRYVKMNNITRNNRFDFSSFTAVDATDKEVFKFQLKDGDFLFNTRNSFELVGKSCIYEADSGEAVLFNNNIMRVRFVDGIDARFVLLAFSSKAVADELNALKSGTTNVSAIYYKDLKSLVIPIPPIAEQKKISTELDALRTETQRLESIYQQKLAALEALKKSLLHQAFSGQL